MPIFPASSSPPASASPAMNSDMVNPIPPGTRPPTSTLQFTPAGSARQPEPSPPTTLNADDADRLAQDQARGDGQATGLPRRRQLDAHPGVGQREHAA